MWGFKEIYVCKEICYKGLAHMITEADKSVHLQVGCQTEGPEKGNVLVQVQRQEESECPSSQALRQKEFSLIQGRVSLFVLF